VENDPTLHFVEGPLRPRGVASRAVKNIVIGDLWEREAYLESGQRLGRIEAVGMGRNRVPRTVGVRVDSRHRLRFFPLTEARVADGRVFLAAPPSLQVVSGGTC
jgi:hypothetical protein